MSPLYVTTGRDFDDRRNSSQVRPPAPDALPTALAALAALRRSAPELVAWVEEGAPLLSEGEHVRRFGRPWAPPRRRR